MRACWPVLGFALLSFSVRAGALPATDAACGTGPDGTQTCSGTLKGWESSPRPTDYFGFFLGGPQRSGRARHFDARFKGMKYDCSIAPSSPLWKLWPQAMNIQSKGFSIQMGSHHACLALVFFKPAEESSPSRSKTAQRRLRTSLETRRALESASPGVVVGGGK